MRQFVFSLLVLSIQSVYGQIDGDRLFDDSFLHEVRFESIDTNIYITTKDYQMANMVIDGETVMDIGFKRKGNISGYPETNKFPMKVKTNKYVSGQEYDGIREFTLHMNHEDPTMLREKLTYEICAEMGLYSLRTAFAKVYIDDVYWGLYTIVEGKDEMYKQIFDNRDADAMESNDFSNMCYEGPNIDDYYLSDFDLYTYDHDNGEFDTAWPRFISMLDKANNTPNDTYVDVASQYLNLRDFFTYQAINVYLLNMDSYIAFRGNQRYVYDTLQNIWQVTPWDFNASFGLWNTNNFSVTDYPLFPGFSCIGNKMEDIPELKTFYLDAMCQLANVVCDTTKMYTRIDELAAQIQDAVYTDNRKGVSNQDFDDGLEYGYHQLFFENQPALKTVIRERFNLITNALNVEGYNCQTTSIAEYIDGTPESLIYPNPSSEVIHFNPALFEEGAPQIKILNSSGQTLFTGQLIETYLNIADFQPGAYYCIVQTRAGIITQKLLKI